MTRRDQGSLTAILLTTRMVDAAAAPLNAREFWQLVAAVSDPGRLLGADDTELQALIGTTTLEPERIAALLDRATAVAFAVERLEGSGITVLTVFDDGYPGALTDRLGPSAPAVLHVAGGAALLGIDLLGVVGSRDVDEDGGEVARDAARHAISHGWGVVSGGARGVDRLAMNAATDAGGGAVGVLADALVSAVQEPDVRRLLADGRVCLATPFAPTMRFTAANAMARNKLIYALARRTLVVASDHDRGGTWAGAGEALGPAFRQPIDVWVGPGAGPGNAALVHRGGRAIDAVEQIWDAPPAGGAEPEAGADQLTMGV